jgi:hypothetical protein
VRFGFCSVRKEEGYSYTNISSGAIVVAVDRLLRFVIRSVWVWVPSRYMYSNFVSGHWNHARYRL